MEHVINFTFLQHGQSALAMRKLHYSTTNNRIPG